MLHFLGVTRAFHNNGSNETSKDMLIHLALKSGVVGESVGEALRGKAGLQMCEIRKCFWLSKI